MERNQFKIAIAANCECVWQVLWNDDTYTQWTGVFGEGSHARTDWKKGSKVLFLGSNSAGMVSRIEDLIPNEYMAFEHLGEVKDMVEDFTSDSAKQWAGARENYTLKNVNGNTELTVEIDLAPAYASYFKDTFPKGLAKVKELAEGTNAA